MLGNHWILGLFVQHHTPHPILLLAPWLSEGKLPWVDSSSPPAIGMGIWPGLANQRRAPVLDHSDWLRNDIWPPVSANEIPFDWKIGNEPSVVPGIAEGVGWKPRPAGNHPAPCERTACLTRRPTQRKGEPGERPSLVSEVRIYPWKKIIPSCLNQFESEFWPWNLE